MRVRQLVMSIFFFSSLVFPQIRPVNMGSCALSSRFSIEGSSGKYYILDIMQRKIFVFDDKGYSGSIGRAGQGPGEFQYPTALSVYKDRVCCIDRFSGSISVFGCDGTIKRYFKLPEENQKQFPYIADFEACDQGYLVAYDKGPLELALYDQDGKFVKGLQRRDYSYKSIAHMYDITIREDSKAAYIFSRFDSSLFIVSLPDLKVVGSLKSFGTYRDSQIKSIINDEDTNSETSKHFNTFIVFSPLLVQGSEFIAIPTANAESKTHEATSVNRSLDIESLRTFSIADALRDVPNKVIYHEESGGGRFSS